MCANYRWLLNTLVTAPDGTGKSGTNTMLNLGLTYTSNGNVKSMSNQDPGGNGSNGPTFINTYYYDGLNRLKSASSTSSLGGGLFPDEGYAFDELGRMSSRSIGNTSYNYAYNDAAHVDAPTGYMGNGYSYDGAGNQTSGAVKSVSQNRTYDAQNRVSSVTTGTTTLSFVYDANDKRVVQSVTTGSNVKRTLYVGNLYEEEISNPSRPYTVYYMMGEKMVGLRRGNQGTNNGQFRMVTDHLGSTSLMVDTASPPTVVDRAYYKPYGEVAFESGSNLTTVGYTGQRLDGDSGLMYYGARYYDPVLSYFISPDPAAPALTNPQSRDRYSYVLNNPLLYNDPTGLMPNTDPMQGEKEEIYWDIRNTFGISLQGFRDIGEMSMVAEAIYDFSDAAGGVSQLREMLATNNYVLPIRRVHRPPSGGESGAYIRDPNRPWVEIYDDPNSPGGIYRDPRARGELDPGLRAYVVHELAHRWWFTHPDVQNKWRGALCHCNQNGPLPYPVPPPPRRGYPPYGYPSHYAYDANGVIPGQQYSEAEDFAETVQIYVYGKNTNQNAYENTPTRSKFSDPGNYQEVYGDRYWLMRELLPYPRDWR